jgi:hypothetical protein
VFVKASASPRTRGTGAASSSGPNIVDDRAETARTELAQNWKQRLISKGGGAAAAPAAGAAVAAAAEE